jgi:hypothetical protein
MEQAQYFQKRNDMEQCVVVFVANSQHTCDAIEGCAGANILTIFREHLSALYGPTMFNYMMTFLPDQKVYAVRRNYCRYVLSDTMNMYE